MSIFKNLVVLGQRAAVSVGQKAVLHMLAERGGSQVIDLRPQTVGEAARAGIKALSTLGLIRLTPIIGRDECYDLRLTDLGRRAVFEIMQNLKGQTT